MNFKEYPRLQKFMAEHPGWTLDEVLTFTENELKKQELEHEPRGRNPISK